LDVNDWPRAARADNFWAAPLVVPAAAVGR